VSDENSIVMTVHGRGGAVDRFTVKLMPRSDAGGYCDAVNGIRLDGDSWVFARRVSEDTQYALADIVPLRFESIADLDDRSIRKVLKETDSQDLSVALRGAAPHVYDRIMAVMSGEAAAMIKEDMEYMGARRKSDVAAAREKILGVVRSLSEDCELLRSDESV